MPTIAQLKEKFDKAIVHIKRDGIDNLIHWLDSETDFFIAPASTRFHGNYDGGLLPHSLGLHTVCKGKWNRSWPW